MSMKSFGAALWALAFVVVSAASALATSDPIEPGSISIAQAPNAQGCVPGTVVAGCGRGGGPSTPGTLVCPGGYAVAPKGICQVAVICPPGTTYEAGVLSRPRKCVAEPACPEAGTQPDMAGICLVRPVCKTGANFGPSFTKPDGSHYCP